MPAAMDRVDPSCASEIYEMQRPGVSNLSQPQLSPGEPSGETDKVGQVRTTMMTQGRMRHFLRTQMRQA